MGIEKGTIFLYSVKCRNKTQRKKIPLCLILPQHSTHRYFKVGAAANEFLRSKIEEGINAVLKAELAGFLGYEKHSSAQSSKSNSPMRIHWNDSPAWSTAITTDGSPEKHIAGNSCRPISPRPWSAPISYRRTAFKLGWKNCKKSSSRKQTTNRITTPSLTKSSDSVSRRNSPRLTATAGKRP